MVRRHDAGGRWLHVTGTSATGCYDGGIKVWDIETGALVANLSSRSTAIQDLALDNDRTVLAAASQAGLRIYTLDSAELIDIGPSRAAIDFTDEECRSNCAPSCE